MNEKIGKWIVDNLKTIGTYMLVTMTVAVIGGFVTGVASGIEESVDGGDHVEPAD